MQLRVSAITIIYRLFQVPRDTEYTLTLLESNYYERVADEIGQKFAVHKIASHSHLAYGTKTTVWCTEN